jgi:hypothetical protein
MMLDRCRVAPGPAGDDKGVDLGRDAVGAVSGVAREVEHVRLSDLSFFNP